MLTDHLQKYFNFTQFRSGQQEIVESIIRGQDVVALMPTGGGKSLCYQLPAVVNQGLTLVISPLIALMKDQVDSLKVRGLKAGCINSSQTPAQLQEVVAQINSRQINLLYIAPERLKSQYFQQLISSQQISFVAIDEAHCVSQWGHDFRADYLKIKDFIGNLRPRPTVAAFTATATLEVRQDIINHLGLKNPQVFVRGFDRPNLKFCARFDLKEDEREDFAVNFIKKNSGAGIVYTLTRKKTEELAEFFCSNGITASAYHAGLDNRARSRIQDEFMENKIRVIVATIAFGMGVNKADIRYVIHLGLPASLENYYQEAGRAGRDGEPAECLLLACGKDFGTQSFFIKKSRESMQGQGKSFAEIEKIINIKYDKLRQMRAYVEDNACRRKTILEYFADADVKNYAGGCHSCDVCLRETLPRDVDEKMMFDMARREHLGFDFNDEADDDEFFERRMQLREMEDYKLAEMNIQHKKSLKKKKTQAVGGTVLESARLYEQNYKAEEIAKLRDLGVGTIIGHLIQWYADGGDLKIEDFIKPEQEKQILRAMAEAADYQWLSPIKEKLPENITYEQIKLVVAKIKRIKI